MKRSVVFFLVLGCMASCAHDPIVYPDPVVTVNDPVASTIYQNGDTMHINVEMSDANELHEGYIYLRSDSDSLFSYAPYVHELPSFSTDTFWVVSGMTTGVSAVVTAVAYNHHDQFTTIEVPITLIP
jgi:hypothetical protein